MGVKSSVKTGVKMGVILFFVIFKFDFKKKSKIFYFQLFLFSKFKNNKK
jgi:hypothetical protein